MNKLFTTMNEDERVIRKIHTCKLVRIAFKFTRSNFNAPWHLVPLGVFLLCTFLANIIPPGRFYIKNYDFITALLNLYPESNVIQWNIWMNLLVFFGYVYTALYLGYILAMYIGSYAINKGIRIVHDYVDTCENVPYKYVYSSYLGMYLDMFIVKDDTLAEICENEQNLDMVIKRIISFCYLRNFLVMSVVWITIVLCCFMQNEIYKAPLEAAHMEVYSKGIFPPYDLSVNSNKYCDVIDALSVKICSQQQSKDDDDCSVAWSPYFEEYRTIGSIKAAVKDRRVSFSETLSADKDMYNKVKDVPVNAGQ